MSIKVYACGGAGINVTGQLLSMDIKSLPTTLHACAFDTSLSNVRKFPTLVENTYVAKSNDNTDGSGKLRKHNGEAIIKNIKSFLIEHEPAEYNIVVFGGAGGTGSVAGPELIAELLRSDHKVVGVMVEDTGDVIAAENCVKTMNTLNNVARDTESDVIISYHRNDKSFKETNDAMCYTIIALANLLNSDNDGLDTADLHHWLQPSKVTEYDAGAYSLLITFGPERFAERVRTPISVASLYKDMSVERLNLFLEYSTFGYTDNVDQFKVDQIHYAISGESLHEHMMTLADEIREKKKQAAARLSSKVSTSALSGLVESSSKMGSTEF